MALPNYLTPYEIRDLLKISYDQALAFIKYSGIDYIKVGRQYRVDEKVLQAFLSQRGGVVIDLKVPIQ